MFSPRRRPDKLSCFPPVGDLTNYRVFPPSVFLVYSIPLPQPLSAVNQNTHGVSLQAWQDACTTFYRHSHYLGGFGTNQDWIPFLKYTGCCAKCGEGGGECKSGLRCVDGVCRGQDSLEGFSRQVWHSVNFVTTLIGVSEAVAWVRGVVTGGKTAKVVITAEQAAEALRVLETSAQTFKGVRAAETLSAVKTIEKLGVTVTKTGQITMDVMIDGEKVTKYLSEILDAGKSWQTIERNDAAFVELLKNFGIVDAATGAVVKATGSSDVVANLGEALKKARDAEKALAKAKAADASEFCLFKGGCWSMARAEKSKSANVAKYITAAEQATADVQRATLAVEVAAEANKARNVLEAPGGIRFVNGMLELPGGISMADSLTLEKEAFENAMTLWSHMGLFEGNPDAVGVLTAHHRNISSSVEAAGQLKAGLANRVPRGVQGVADSHLVGGPGGRPLVVVENALDNIRELEKWYVWKNVGKTVKGAEELREGTRSHELFRALQAFLDTDRTGVKALEAAERLKATADRFESMNRLVSAEKFVEDAKLLKSQKSIGATVLKAGEEAGAIHSRRAAAENLWTATARMLADDAVVVGRAVDKIEKTNDLRLVEKTVKTVEAGGLLVEGGGAAEGAVKTTVEINNIPLAKFLKMDEGSWKRIMEVAGRSETTQTVQDLINQIDFARKASTSAEDFKALETTVKAAAEAQEAARLAAR